MLGMETKQSTKAGLPPGTLVHGGKSKVDETKLTLMEYDADHLYELESITIGECLDYLDTPAVTWLNVDGLSQTEMLAQLGEDLHLHPLLQEDLVNTNQRPKLEDHATYLFVVLKTLEYSEPSRSVKIEQISLVLGSHYVISIQEDIGGVFDSVRERIRSGGGRLRRGNADYLAYALIDAIVDRYFTVLEKIGDDIENLEAELIANPDQSTLQSIYRLRRQIIAIRRSVWPMREVISMLERGESPLILPETRIYFRDVHDHTIQVIDTIEAIRDLLGGMLEIYLSATGNRMNEIMKVLTIFASIFIPLTFLAGVYGMNFRYLPELGWRWGYAGFWLICLLTVSGMLLYFRRKRWL